MQIKKYIKNIYIYLIAIAIPLSNIKLFTFYSDIKIMHICAIFLSISYLTERIKIIDIIFYILLLGLPLLSIINAINISAFISSYVMWFILTSFILFGIGFTSNHFTISEHKKLLRLSIYLYIVTSMIGIIQFLLNNFFLYGSFYNFLGEFQSHPHYDNTLYGLYRSTSLFIEPSQFGWISIFYAALLIYLRQTLAISRRLYYVGLIIIFFGILSTISASAYIGTTILYFLVKIVQSKKSQAAFVKITTIIFIFTLIFIFQSEIFIYFRLDSIFIEGTSGYIRIMEPILSVLEVFDKYILFGRGLGQQDIFDVTLSYSGHSIDNAIFGYFVVFGLFLGPIIIATVVLYFRGYIFNKENRILIYSIFFAYLSTGAFVALEIPFLFLLFISATITKFKKFNAKPIDINASKNSTGNFRYLSGNN